MPDLNLFSKLFGGQPNQVNIAQPVQTNTELDQLKKELSDLQQRGSKLLASQNTLIYIVEGIGDGVIALDINKRIILFNKAAQQISGLSTVEVIGKHFDEVLKIFSDQIQIRAADLCPTTAPIEDKIIFSKPDAKLTHKSGKAVTVDITSEVSAQAYGLNLGCIITLHDLSKEQHLESMKMDFVSMAAHELRTPITSIKGYLDVFINENSKKLDSEANQLLSQMNIATQKLLSLVENLLNVSRIERGIITMNMNTINWLEQVKSTIEDFKPKALEKNILLNFKEPSVTIPSLEADKIRISEVLSNLLSNAINYTPSGGKIEISIDINNQEVITNVSDTGPGIPQEAIPHLFTKFFRISNNLTQKSKGNGLGLYISKSIIDIHHGKIWAQSEVGKGSTFSFSLPIKQIISSYTRHL